ncbi:uncharacterized protein LOC121416072 [Lytechinus variegatus]|uniref:uncharacterized protein LOC121416072 n=1 Tax=Lytechinus variegatus TaxID=7654 RepID=UPI001BB13CEA|nr:uncharacterized protein LOC121416072 [Lytechinus variegatus]
MTRRGGPISDLIWDSYSMRGPEVKSITGALTKLQYNSVVVVLFTIIAILGLFLILLMMSNSGWTAADFQVQSSYEHRMLKIENLRLSLEASEKKEKKLEDEKKSLSNKLELVSKKFLDTRIEFDKANKNAKRTKTEMDDRLHQALTEGSKALTSYQNTKARADELEEILREVRAERRLVQTENEALAVKLGRAIEKGEAAEDEINKLKAYYGMKADTPRAILVPQDNTDPLPQTGIKKTKIDPIQIIPEDVARTLDEEIHQGHSHRRLPSKVVPKPRTNGVFVETVLDLPPTHKKNAQATMRDEV